MHGHEVAREAREARGDARALELVGRADVRLLRHRDFERACAEAESLQLRDVRPALAHDVEPGDAAVDDAVLHVLGNVVRAHEQRLDGGVAARERERAVTGRLRPETCVVEERDRRIAQTALRRYGDPQDLRRRCSASR